MSNKLKILIVEDSEDDSLLIVRELKKGGLVFEHHTVDNRKSMLEYFDNTHPDIVLSDFSMPMFSGVEALAITQEFNSTIPFIIISGAVGEEKAVELIRSGAHDFVMKGNMLRLVPAVSRALDMARIRSERQTAREELIRLNAELETKVNERTNQLIITNKQLQKEIEAHKGTESELNDTKNFLNTILENIPDVISVKEITSLRYTYVNKACEKLYGLPKDSLIGKSAFDLFNKSLAEHYESNDRTIINKKKPIDFHEELFKTKQHELKLFFTKKLLINDDKNEPKYLLSISEDITQRKKAEKELKKHEMRFISLFRSSPVAIAVFESVSSDILDVNQSFLDLTGCTRNEVINKSFVGLDIWETDGINELINRHRNSSEKVVDKELCIVSKQGSKKTVLVAMEHLPNEDENDMLIFIAQDITAIKSAEEEIKKSLIKERDLNLLKTRFISMISHEYRTPLTTIMLSADLLKRYGDNWEPAEKIKHFDRIQDTVLRMTQLMETVLTIGRLETGRLGFQPEPLDLPSYCQSIAENIQFAHKNKNNIIFSYNGINNNPKVDENLLGLVLTNMLNNAVKYSPQGRKVEFSVESKETEAVFTIRDYGIGIPEEDLKHLFNSFFRASNVGTIEGYGLGLNIVKNCIDTHKGRIDVESQVNYGTTFRIYLPTNLERED